MSQFEEFINTELPRRISSKEDPLSMPAGKVFVTTGTGLDTVPMDYGSDGETIERKPVWTANQW